MSDCIEWGGARSAAGYGQKRVGGKAEYTHRLALLELHVPIAGMIVRHHCDNPPCYNPDHLTVGTRRDNLNDAIERGQWEPPMNKGEQIGTSKLTEYAVRWMRSLYQAGHHTQTELADMFGVTQASVSGIIRRETWRHVA